MRNGETHLRAAPGGGWFDTAPPSYDTDRRGLATSWQHSKNTQRIAHEPFEHMVQMSLGQPIAQAHEFVDVLRFGMPMSRAEIKRKKGIRVHMERLYDVPRVLAGTRSNYKKMGILEADDVSKVCNREERGCGGDESNS